MNDLKRIPLLQNGRLKEASDVSLENYTKKTKKNEKQACGASLCLLFKCDVENEWDIKFECVNLCNVHTRCEGLVLMDEGEEVQEGYKCVRCQSKRQNSEWLEDALEAKNIELTNMQHKVIVRMTSVKSEIDHHEHTEESISGPKQRMLKEAMLKLGDIARYHGGDMQ